MILFDNLGTWRFHLLVVLRLAEGGGVAAGWGQLAVAVGSSSVIELEAVGSCSWRRQCKSRVTALRQKHGRQLFGVDAVERVY